MQTGRSILIVEDEADLADVISFQLEREGYSVRKARDGLAALAEIKQRAPDLVVLDRMLPKLSGDEVLTRLKRETRTAHLPIIMLTAKAEDADELTGFALGADDYIRKPFSMRLLIARIQAVLRRDRAGEEREVVRRGPVVLDRARHEVTVDGAPIGLTATEFRVLATLMGAGGRVLNREQLIDTVLGHGVAVTNRTIDVHVAALRKKLGSAANCLQTIRGVGYTFRVPTEDESSHG